MRTFARQRYDGIELQRPPDESSAFRGASAAVRRRRRSSPLVIAVVNAYVPTLRFSQAVGRLLSLLFVSKRIVEYRFAVELASLACFRAWRFSDYRVAH